MDTLPPIKLFLWIHYQKKQHFKVNFWKWGPITIWHNIKCVQFFLLQKSLHPTAPHVVPCCLINDLMLLFRQQAGTQHERNYLIDIYQNYIRIKSQLLKKQYIYRNRVCFGIHMAQFRYSGIAHWQHSCGERSLNPHILQVLKDERTSYSVHKACIYNGKPKDYTKCNNSLF